MLEDAMSVSSLQINTYLSAPLLQKQLIFIQVSSFPLLSLTINGSGRRRGGGKQKKEKKKKEKKKKRKKDKKKKGNVGVMMEPFPRTAHRAVIKRLPPPSPSAPPVLLLKTLERSPPVPQSQSQSHTHEDDGDDENGTVKVLSGAGGEGEKRVLSVE
ncbi:unnamed protein product [Pleuronectes platessa]|uniref:Uncharacterized protein n=1 Tax=Pleuronectes platessa TaxID=8262 RepID=A0A9N7TTD8_PLEPL|nr:unnamed protein product [Pleuronectes platessa]